MKLIHPNKAPVSARLRPRLITDTSELAMAMLQGDRSYTFDANMGLSDGVAAYTASGYAQYAGADGIVDLGGNQGVTITLPSIADVTSITPQQARIDAVCALDLTAVTTSGSALEKVLLVGCNNTAFTSNVALLAMLEFGNSSVLDVLNGFTTAAPNSVGGSRYEMPFTNEQNNVKYEYVKLYNVISGSGSITYVANIFVLPEP